jgi:hypothetical protein
MLPLCWSLCRLLPKDAGARCYAASLVVLSVAWLLCWLLCRLLGRFLSRDDAALSFALPVASLPLLANRSCFVDWFHWREEPAFLVALSNALSVFSGEMNLLC